MSVMFPFPRGSAVGLTALLPDGLELLPSLDNPFFPSFGKSLHWPLQSLLGSSPASRPGEAVAPTAGRKPVVTHCGSGGPMGLATLKGGGMLWGRAEPLLHHGAAWRAHGVGGLETQARPQGMVPRRSELGSSHHPPPPPPPGCGTFLGRAMTSPGALSPTCDLAAPWPLGTSAPSTSLCRGFGTEQPWLGLG